MAKQKIHSTTQDFTELVDIIDDMVLLKGKNACMILEVSSVNFFLLSADEQSARVYGYMSLINSLSFAIQIVIVSKRVDMGAYIKLLDQKIESTQNLRMKDHLTLYKEFIETLVKDEGLLDKKIYIVIPYSYLEASPLGGATPGAAAKTAKKAPTNNGNFADTAKAALTAKVEVIMAQVSRMGLTGRSLSHEELIKLYYELLNNDVVNLDFNSQDIKNVIL